MDFRTNSATRGTIAPTTPHVPEPPASPPAARPSVHTANSQSDRFESGPRDGGHPRLSGALGLGAPASTPPLSPFERTVRAAITAGGTLAPLAPLPERPHANGAELARSLHIDAPRVSDAELARARRFMDHFSSHGLGPTLALNALETANHLIEIGAEHAFEHALVGALTRAGVSAGTAAMVATGGPMILTMGLTTYELAHGLYEDLAAHMRGEDIPSPAIIAGLTSDLARAQSVATERFHGRLSARYDAGADAAIHGRAPESSRRSDAAYQEGYRAGTAYRAQHGALVDAHAMQSAAITEAQRRLRASGLHGAPQEMRATPLATMSAREHQGVGRTFELLP